MWLELLTDYDMSILYQQDKANFESDALNMLSIGSAAHVEKEKRELAKYLHRLACLGLRFMDNTNEEIVVKNGLSHH